MPNVYTRMTKINNVLGRSDYISNPDRQEHIVLHQVKMEYDWQVHVDFENQNQKSASENNQARELVIALPNKLDLDRAELQTICDELADSIVGPNKDYEYAVHWNHTKTNLHMHLLFSERENQIDLEPKIYKRDIWMDKDTHKLAKANAANAELVHRKGEIQRDKNGNIKYQSELFKAKDKRFKSLNFTTHTVYTIIQNVLNDHGYTLGIQEKVSPYLSQKKLYKGAREDYIQKATEWNKSVKEYNKTVKEHLNNCPEEIDRCIDLKEQVIEQTKSINRSEKKIMSQAIQIIKKAIGVVHEWIEFFKLQIQLDRYDEFKEELSNEGFGEIDVSDPEEVIIYNRWEDVAGRDIRITFKVNLKENKAHKVIGGELDPNEVIFETMQFNNVKEISKYITKEMYWGNFFENSLEQYNEFAWNHDLQMVRDEEEWEL